MAALEGLDLLVLALKMAEGSHKPGNMGSF